ncbi:hypothetical protein J3R83DRAFT_8448 [Lanmaoa asiatica]|nr:hypothetical protein J3R83DRAFT_8448 [Lanmaoa asiatica]
MRFQDFENTLKEVVNAKRLSASKMNRLTEIAMKSLEDDTKLVAILYRTHKSLPSSAKVSSLYAFDALARAARGLVNKRGITGDINSGKGSPATFLLKIEGVLDGLFQDMVSLDNSEAKEKTKKVLDIWVKSNTFPSTVLTRLRDVLSDVQKENVVNPTPPIDPRAATEMSATIMTSQPVPHTPSGPVPDVQATLLALLGQAAQITSQGQPPGQTPPNTDPQLQRTQLALLQQLALTAKLANGSPTPPPGQTPPPTDGNPSPAVIPAPEPLRPSQTRGSRFDTPRDTRYARNGYPDRAREQRDFRDERHSRGGPRGGHRGRGRWDDHHNHDRFRHRDWDPPSRPRRSRSRSPRRQEEPRNVRLHSPPRRPLNDRDPHHQPELPTPPTSAHDKDEFGRDIRVSSQSPSRSTSVEDTEAPAPMDSSVDPAPGVPPDYHTPVSDQLPSVAASTSAESTETHAPSSALQQPGLDHFDINTFDATAPSSWEALGNMWQTTHGYPPSQEELMHFMMAGSMAATGIANDGFDGAQGGQWQQGNWEEQGSQRSGGWRGGRGRGNYVGGRGGHGNYRNGGGYANVTEQPEPSCAIILNGDVEPSDGPEANNQSLAQDHSDEQSELYDSTTNASARGNNGRMQRIGDKWMFVRDA